MKKCKLLLTALMLVAIVALCMGCENESSDSDEKHLSYGTYTLEVKNNSEQAGNFCIYQTIPDQKNNKNIYSLVWLSKTAHPTQNVTFTWTTDFSFVWAETGKLKPGVMFNDAKASGSKDADPANVYNNLALFGINNTAYLFKDTAEKGQLGFLTIKADNTIPNNVASIGIGMSVEPAIAINAVANETYQFTPTPIYWIIFGDFTEGEVLDLSVINPSAGNVFSQTMKIVFPLNVYELSLSFTEGNTWEVVN